MSSWRFIAVGALLMFSLLSCSESTPTFHASENPARLSDWNMFELTPASLTPTSHTMVFRPANQLFTDYAQKLRSIWIPNGAQASLID